ncbi:UDP-N-acetylmuramate dehydrogenase [Phormidium yuhuli AB48]|uniref:UDP-N-acetylenolpyruvoylglucosamine reductase n=1 Tax=Phormidium yuhuli AB48 TaxID=2940671 RepID=A0ABY5AY30_9CYAN|nr:UDP-N-acetylmuramate dehydrogenase [Phormidium yuhuli AB48]
MIFSHSSPPPSMDLANPGPIHILGAKCPLYPQIPLAKMTTLRVGGVAEWYMAPRLLDDLYGALAWANSEGLPITVLGAGSNLLIGDRGIPGLVISTRYLRDYHLDGSLGIVKVAAGFPLPKLAWELASRGLSGFEWAVGIPGTLGGAVVMNAGAHRSCLADNLIEVEVLDSDGGIVTLPRSALGYSYRTSCLQGSSQLVLGATLQLQGGEDPLLVRRRTDKHLKQRHGTQPYHRPSCGSVFRNPKPQAAGWLIEQAGLKGYRVGGVHVANEHANFILNSGQGTAQDAIAVIRHVRDVVRHRWDVELQPEVKLIGEFSQDVSDLW